MTAYNPLEYYQKLGWLVTSHYGMRPDPFGSGVQVMHYGTDFAGKPRGYPVQTPYAGTVTARGAYGGRGQTVVMRLTPGVLQLCQHLDEYRCAVGDRLKAGDPVGTNGRTGNVTGVHMHYELRVDNGSILGSPVWGDPRLFYLETDNHGEILKAAIVINSYADFPAAEPLARRLNCPIFLRNATGQLQAEKIYVAGGGTGGLPGSSVDLSGANRYETAGKIYELLQSLK